MPAILKAYFEMIASRLYYFYKKKMLAPKPVVCLITRDGFYPADCRLTDPRFPFPNVQETLLSAAIGFLGLSKTPKFIAAQGLDMKARLPQIVAGAIREIDAYVAQNALK